MKTKNQKKKVLSYRYDHSTNLGDEIQTIAAVRALKKLGYEVDHFVNRKSLDTKETGTLLVNGYFEPYELEKFFDPHKLSPRFSNVHINARHPDLSKPDRLNKFNELLPKFKQFEPIGCRDRFTLSLFEKAGVKAFFNYCMTLTFERRDESIKGDRIFVVDLNRHLPFPDFLLQEKFEQISHECINPYSHETKMQMAEELLERYRTQAKLVVTRRLHCALPCLAMGIPVVFFGDSKNERLRLIQELIPLNHWVERPDVPCLSSRSKKWPKFSQLGKIARVYREPRNTAKFQIRHLRGYYSQYRRVDWNPKPVDLEETKKQILARVKEMMER